MEKIIEKKVNASLPKYATMVRFLCIFVIFH
jgi:hypothetical protein